MPNSVPVVVHADPHNLILIDDVGHIAIDEVGKEASLLLINHKHLFFLGDDAYLLIKVEDVEISGLLERAEVKIEFSLEIGIPAIVEGVTRR
jgi:hypothetical protein